MLQSQPFMRDDTFLGVCQALGDAFRIPSNLVRLAFAPVLVASPLVAAAGYVAAALVIAIVYAILPDPKKAAASVEVETAEPAMLAERSAPVQNEIFQELPVAA